MPFRVCLSVYFITFEILQATTDDICPWFDYYLINTSTHTWIHTDTQLLTHTHRSLMASFIFSSDPPPSLLHEHVSVVTYCRFLLSIHVQFVFRGSDKSHFIHRGAHEWSRHTLLAENVTLADSRAKILTSAESQCH